MDTVINQSGKGAGKQVRRPVKKKRKGGRIPLIVCLAVVALLVGFTTVLGLFVSGVDTIYPNLRLNGVELGGLSAEEAADVLDKAGYNVYEDAAVTVSLPMDYSLEITAEEAGVVLSSASAADSAYRYGREGGFVGNTLTYIKCRLFGADLDGDDSKNIDEEAVRARIAEVVREVDAALMSSELNIGEEEITVVKGAKSMTIDEDEIFRLVAEAFAARNWSAVEYDPVITADDELDLQGLYDTVFREPADAVYDPETGEATEHQNGLSFDMDQARNLWDAARNGDTVVIPLIVTEPEITTEYLNSVLFADLLGQKSTTLSGSSSARINNITKAADAINGIVLNPGDEFSYNDVLGPRTAANGYLPAGAYSGGKVVTEYGGGICQVSSTLYYVSLLANLKITDRTNHYFGVSYLPAGLDATVSWGGPEFKFVNDREYPVKIEAYTDMTSYTVVIKMWGTNPDGSYVQLSTDTWTLENGYGAVSYRLLYDADGNLISKTEEASSRYYYHTEEVESPSPSPSKSPSPSPSTAPSPSNSASPTPVNPSPPADSPPASEPPVTELPVTEPPVTEPTPTLPVEPPADE